MRLVQFLQDELQRRVGLVDGDRLRLIDGFTSVYDLAFSAIDNNTGLNQVIERSVSDESVEYTDELMFLPAFDHPGERARLLVSGTGLTHRKSAQTRNSMHTGVQTITDSMRMYEWGVEGGRPAPGAIGTPPEWFYKGNGYVLRAHNEELQIPAFADDGGDEAELAGCYVIDWSGTPRRIGLAVGNEFSDHVMERKNYLYLAPSKLRQCAIGPELVVGAEFENVRGAARILRSGTAIWRKDLLTGEENMCHSLGNMEHHHFKYSAHRQPGDAHVHFFGAGAFSFGEISLEDGDVMEIAFEGFGRPLRNEVRRERGEAPLIQAVPL
ncbi:MAG TPA: AraD1 family protein [Bryobacteraceae bacterium]|nr:AraD1 family protein [Bryobacteraceae bacterium]